MPGGTCTPIEVEVLPASAGADRALIGAVTSLVNQVYAMGEAGLWLDGASRTCTKEIARLTRAGQVAVARRGGRIVGCVQVEHADAGTAQFDMLAADFGHRSTGIGRELVRFAERHGAADGCTLMQLELLVPRGWTHPSKAFLADWYDRMGYRVYRTRTMDEVYPEKRPLLATPCDLLIYQKKLTAPG